MCDVSITIYMRVNCPSEHLTAAKMASSPTTVPPPPPPCPAPLQPAQQTNIVHIRELVNPEEEMKQTVERLPSWRQTSSQESRTLWVACNHQVRYISQEGPTCGLVALCMAASMIQSPIKSPAAVLASARQQGYTIQGEMFSASNTLKFAETEFDMTGRLLSGGLESHVEEVVIHLARGLPVLVPYDKDSNNEPAAKKGHSAHWAVLTGFLLALPHDVSLPLSCHGDNSTPDLVCHLPPWSADMMSILPQLLCQTSQLYVFARQGKSRLLGAWRYDTLAQSNKNLTEYDPTLEGDFVLHPEGLAAGLAEKIILLQKIDK